MRLLALLIVTIAFSTGSTAGAGGHSGMSAGSGLTARPCGYLDVGKGWHVRATRNVNCVSARRLIRTFFALPRCLSAQRHPGKACAVNGYRCVETYAGDDRGLVRCTRPSHLVSALSNR